MFRRKALERRHEPDALDQLLVIVSPRSVLAVLALAGVLAVAVGWSILARIPVKVDGQGILMRPGFVSRVQATSDGRLISVLVEAGDRVRAGDTLATLSQPALERELDRLNAQFDARRVFAERQIELATRARTLERNLAADRREETEGQLQSLEALRQSSAEQREIAMQDRREKLSRIEDLLERQRAEQQERMQGVEELRGRGIVNNDQLLTALTAVTSSAIEAARVELQISETRLSEIEAVEEELRLLNEIQLQRAELTRIDIDEQQAERAYSDLVQSERESVEEIAAQIRNARQELDTARRIDSPYDGVILELLATEGGLVSVGGPIAMMSLDAQSPLIRVALSADARVGSFRIVVNGVATEPLAHDADGPAVAKALAALPAFAGFGLTGAGRLAEGPVDVRFTRREADRTPHFAVEIRDRELWTADGRPATGSVRLLGAEAPERPLSHVGFFPIGLGKQISPGMEIRIEPSSLERQRFGAMIGKVTAVSDFAMTEEGMLQVVGNSEVASALAGAGGAIMVDAALVPDPSDPTGFEWTARSPGVPVTEGTTTTAHVVVEERRPISFVIPLLRQWMLGEGAAPTAAEIAAGRRP